MSRTSDAAGPPPLNLPEDGAEICPAALSDGELAQLRALADRHLDGRPGVRLTGTPVLRRILGPAGSIGRIATGILGRGTRAVRCVLFDKTADSNWAVPWHQDRTITVRERREVEGFGPWTVKAAAVHVEPPVSVMDRMITLRAHLDHCGEDNAPLLVAPGSHRLGRIEASHAAATAERLGTAACLAEAGDVWLYASTILHASQRAKIPMRRRVLHVDYANFELPGGLAWDGIA